MSRSSPQNRQIWKYQVGWRVVGTTGSLTIRGLVYQQTDGIRSYLVEAHDGERAILRETTLNWVLETPNTELIETSEIRCPC